MWVLEKNLCSSHDNNGHTLFRQVARCRLFMQQGAGQLASTSVSFLAGYSCCTVAEVCDPISANSADRDIANGLLIANDIEPSETGQCEPLDHQTHSIPSKRTVEKYPCSLPCREAGLKSRQAAWRPRISHHWSWHQGTWNGKASAAQTFQVRAAQHDLPRGNISRQFKQFAT